MSIGFNASPNTTLPTTAGFPSLLFTPRDFGPGLVKFWGRAADFVLDGNQVSAWLDHSGNGHNLTAQYYAPAGPQTSHAPIVIPTAVNGKPGIVGMPADSYPITVGETVNTPDLRVNQTDPFWACAIIELQAALSQNESSTVMGAYGGDANNQRSGWQLFAGYQNGPGNPPLSNVVSIELASGFGNSIRVFGSTIIQVGVPYRIQACKDNTANSSGYRLFVNGVAETLTVAQDNLGAGVTNNPQQAFQWNGTKEMACNEMLFMNFNPSTSNVADMDAYLLAEIT